MGRPKSIQSKTDCFSETFENPDAMLRVIQERFDKTGTAVFYLDHAVAIGRFDGRKMTFPEPVTLDPTHLQKARIFDDHSELLIWRKELRKFGCRVRKDGQGERTEVIDSDPFLTGAASVGASRGFALLSEDRGSRFYIPAATPAAPGAQYRLAVRYYVGFHPETHQAEFVDMRFVAFIPAERRDRKET